VFVGRWCVIQTDEPSDTVSIHHRAPCRRDEGQVTMRSDGFETDEIRCKLLIAAAVPKYGNHQHLTKFWCEASDGRNQTVNYWMSVDEKGVCLRFRRPNASREITHAFVALPSADGSKRAVLRSSEIRACSVGWNQSVVMAGLVQKAAHDEDGEGSTDDGLLG
jgi:hypothetical protein